MPRAAITQIAKLIGRELGSGQGPSDAALAAVATLSAADASAEIVQRLFAEAQRKRPDERMINAYVFMLQITLGTLRLEANGGRVSAGRTIEGVRDEIERILAKGPADPVVLMLVARAFAQAELDPGQALKEAMMAAMEAQPTPPSGLESTGMVAQFADLAAALDHDPFAIHAEVSAMGAAFPAEHQAAMAAALAMSDTEAAREAALGFAFASDPAISAAALAAVAQQGRGPGVSSITIERLVRMRPWLSEERRPSVDSAIRTLRPRAALPVSAARPETHRVLASLCDGAGAQSLFVLAKRGRRFVLASLLIKAEIGVADAWVRDDMTRAEADAMIGEIIEGAEAVEVSIALLERRLADALATNVAKDAPPPFGLLQVSEMFGLVPLHPQHISPPALVDALLADVAAERVGTAAALVAHRASAEWGQAFETLNSWFEAGEPVETLLRPLKTRKRRIEAVLTEVLPARRGFWAERCAWMAATLKESVEGDEDWIDFALVARDLAGERPLDAMPIAARIAAATVEAFRLR